MDVGVVELELGEPVVLDADQHEAGAEDGRSRHPQRALGPGRLLEACRVVVGRHRPCPGWGSPGGAHPTQRPRDEADNHGRALGARADE